MTRTFKYYAKIEMIIGVCDELPDDAGSWAGWAGRLHDPDNEQFMLKSSGPLTFEEIKDMRYKYFDENGGI